MMRAHGIASNAATIKPAPASRAPKTERRKSSATSNKKRKIEGYEDSAAGDDEESFGNANSSIKSESGTTLTPEQFVVKEEDEVNGQLSTGEAADLLQYYETPSQYSGNEFDSYTDGKNLIEYSRNSGYATPYGYGLNSPTDAYYPPHTPLDLGMGSFSDVSRSNGQSAYQPMMQYIPEDQGQGHSNSPLVVE